MVGGVWKAYSPFKTFTVTVPVPTPQSPTGTITDKTPTYKWTKVTGATQYRFQLMKGTTVVYTKTVASSACGTTTCTNTPTTALGLFAYKWKVQAAVGTVWSSYSAFKTFTVTAPVPTPQSPSGSITDTTPTYKWTTVTGATQYRYQLLQGTTVVYTKTVAATVCGASTCSNTPTTALGYLAYKWKVQAMVGGVWNVYSAFKTFTVSAPSTAKAGYWQYMYGDFYVTPDETNVNSFAFRVNVNGCPYTQYRIYRTVLDPIVNKNFSFNDMGYYASGTFDTATSSHGTVGLNSYYIAGCGYVTVSPAVAWTATWVNSTQPSIVVEGQNGSVVQGTVSQNPSRAGVNATVKP